MPRTFDDMMIITGIGEHLRFTPSGSFEGLGRVTLRLSCAHIPRDAGYAEIHLTPALLEVLEEMCRRARAAYPKETRSMRVSTHRDDPGFLSWEHTRKLVVFLDGVDQSTVKERCIFTADEEEGLIRFHRTQDGGPSYALVMNDAGDKFEEFELRGHVEIRHKDGEMPMQLRGFGV